jgi:hypothetical protein
MHYHWAGYHNPKDPPPAEGVAKDPPGLPPAVSTSAKQPVRPTPTPIRPTTKEPPLAPPLEKTAAPAPLPAKVVAPEGPDLGPPPTP